MNLLIIILSGFREIKAHWFRSALTMFGVICGVASLVTMAAFVKGKENLLRESLAQSGGLERITIESEDDLPDYQKHLEDVVCLHVSRRQNLKVPLLIVSASQA